MALPINIFIRKSVVPPIQTQNQADRHQSMDQSGFSQQSSDKVRTNLGQSSGKVEQQHEPNLSQSEAKDFTISKNLSQEENKSALLEQESNTPEIVSVKKKFSRGIRPDHIARGEVFSSYAQPTNETVGKLAANDKQTASKPLAMREQTVSNKKIEELEPLKPDPNTKPNPISFKGERNEDAVSLALDSRLIDVSSPLKETGNSREVAVSSALDKKSPRPLAVRQALATPLEGREFGVRKNDNSALDIALLVGKEKNLVFIACDECKKIGSLETNYISTDELKIKLSTDSNGLRNLIHRTKGKGFIDVESKQLGRNGLRKFKIPQSIYQQFLNSPLDSRESGVSQPVGQALGTALNEPPVVVVSNSLTSKTTNTELPDSPCFLIPENLTGLVSRRQLSEFVTLGKISESELQLSLDAFAYDLKNKLVSSKLANPIAILIGAIKNNGSYNSAKYIEALRAELKPILEKQIETTAKKETLKNSKEWTDFQEFKTSNPEKYKLLAEKFENLGFKGEMLQDFTFIEYKNSIVNDTQSANLNPLAAPESVRA